LPSIRLYSASGIATEIGVTNNTINNYRRQGRAPEPHAKVYHGKTIIDVWSDEQVEDFRNIKGGLASGRTELE
jgi:hypothetical protein